MERALGSRYQLGEQLGAGAMGQVFLGTDPEGRRYACKILRPELTADPAAVARFLQERSILVRLRHPNLVSVYDLVAEGDTVGIVMDLITGQDLRKALVAGGPLLPAEVARIGAGLASALAVVHAAGVVHRDLKPENVLLDTSASPPTPRLTDFGISRFANQADLGRSTLLVGTPQYIAPELVDGEEPTGAVDLYALGIVLYELCCGVTPFAGGSVLTVLRRHAEMTPGRPEGIPDPLWEVVSWLLAKSPGGRPQSAQQVATVLDALAVDLRGVPVAPRLETPPPPSPSVHEQQTQGVGPMLRSPSGSAGASGPRRRGRLVAVAVGATVLLVGGWAVSATRGGDSASSPVATTTGLPATDSGVVTADPTDSTGSDQTSTDPSTPTLAPSAALDGPAPNLVGRQLADAQGLLPASVQIVPSDTVDADATDGTILSQNPTAGKPLTSTMKVTVARQPVVAYLSDLVPTIGEWDLNQTAEMSGKPYAHSVGDYLSACSSNSSPIEYNLARGYRKLVLTAGLDDNSQDSSLQALFEVFADGRRVSGTNVHFGKPVKKTVDVTGVLRLKLQWQVITGDPVQCGRDVITLGEPELLGLPGEVPQSTDGSTLGADGSDPGAADTPTDAPTS